MRIAAAVAVVVASFHFVAAPETAKAEAVIRGNSCFSGVSSDADDAKEECARAGFSCTAPRVMSCYFDNVRHMYICQCKAPPPKNPQAYSREGRPLQSRPSPQMDPPPEADEESMPPNEPQLLSASAHSC